MLPLSIKKQILKSHLFLSLEVEDLHSSSYDDVDEKEVSNGDSIAIYDSLTHSVFSMFSIMDYKIHMQYLSHFVHASLLDGAQPSDFQDVFLAKSSPYSVLTLTILDPMCFNSSSFVLGTHSQSLLEDFEHHYLSSLHSSTIEDSLPVYSHVLSLQENPLGCSSRMPGS